MSNTSILVRAQARGGKFLGPAIGGANLSVVNLSTGQVIASGTEAGTASGVMGGSYVAGASFETINTNPGAPAAPIVYWLSPDEGTPGLMASFDLNAPSLIECVAVGFGGTTVRETLFVTPGAQLTDPGIVLIVPGLAVSGITAKVQGSQLDVQVTVTMMCGCKIGADSPWPPSEFQVTCAVSSGGSAVALFPLALGQESSVFTGTGDAPASGKYDVTIYAVQPSTNNQGTASVTLQT